jgi:hypothetical protein
MKTTELFAEQVLIGLLVISIVGLLVYDYANPIVTLNGKSTLELIVTGGLLVGAAYLIGMVYDRVSDTILQDIESHCRLHFVSRMKPDELERSLAAGQDPFEEGKYRIIVLGNGQAANHMEYLRSRIRLTRSLATLLPGLTVALLLAMDFGKTSPWWEGVAVTIPLAYLLVFILKLRKRPSAPPKTYETGDLKKYLDRARSLPKSSNPLKRPPLRFLLQDEVWFALVLLTLAASILILSTRSYARFSVLVVGLLLTIIVGWSWWRISITFYAFLRDYEKYGGCKPRA